MNRVYIAIEGAIEHKESVYTVVTSLLTNKNNCSKYVIYIITNDADDAWDAIKSMEDENIEIRIQTESIMSITDTNKLIYLKWNTLVMGDLSEFYSMDLEGKSFAAAKNFPEAVCNIPMEYKAYNDAVRLIDIKQWKEELDSDYKELSIYFNFGYEECIKADGRIINKNNEDGKEDYYNIKESALILRTDPVYSPEKYFDTIMSEIWLKYYKLSPLKDIPLNRQASMGTSGAISVDSNIAIPILIWAEDKRAVNIIELINSMTEHLSIKRQLDIRILYYQLSLSNQELLLKQASDTVSIVLHNVKQLYANNSFELLTAQVFDSYEKAICIQPNVIPLTDISLFYDIALGEYWLGAGEKLVDGKSDDVDLFFKKLPQLDNAILLINNKEWWQNTICEKLNVLWNQTEYASYLFSQILSLVCMKKSMRLDNEKYISSYEEKEDEDLRDVLNQITALEEENNKLKERNRNLQAEKRNLMEERDQYLYEILEIRKSITYKVGRLITLIPRLIRGKK